MRKPHQKNKINAAMPVFQKEAEDKKYETCLSCKICVCPKKATRIQKPSDAFGVLLAYRRRVFLPLRKLLQLLYSDLVCDMHYQCYVVKI